MIPWGTARSQRGVKVCQNHDPRGYSYFRKLICYDIWYYSHTTILTYFCFLIVYRMLSLGKFLDPTRGLEFERGLYVRKIFLRTAMLRMWYNYDITLSQKGLFNKIISREKNENLYIQYVFYYILQIFYMISQSLFYGCCPSSERCSSCASR